MHPHLPYPIPDYSVPIAKRLGDPESGNHNLEAPPRAHLTPFRAASLNLLANPGRQFDSFG